MREWLDKRLRELKDRGLKKSKVGLAKAMLISPPRVTEILRSERSIKSEELPRMAKYLEWTVDELLQRITGEGGNFDPVRDRFVRVPLVSWVEASKYAEITDPYEVGVGEDYFAVPYHKDTLIALRVRGNSMNRVAPAGSILIVDYSEKMLTPGKIYVIKHGQHEATCKRYKASPDRFEPDSTEPFETIFPDHDTEIVGRVIRVENEV